MRTRPKKNRAPQKLLPVVSFAVSTHDAGENGGLLRLSSSLFRHVYKRKWLVCSRESVTQSKGGQNLVARRASARTFLLGNRVSICRQTEMGSWILSVEPSQGVHEVRNPRSVAWVVSGGELFGSPWSLVAGTLDPENPRHHFEILLVRVRFGR